MGADIDHGLERHHHTRSKSKIREAGTTVVWYVGFLVELAAYSMAYQVLHSVESRLRYHCFGCPGIVLHTTVGADSSEPSVECFLGRSYEPCLEIGRGAYYHSPGHVSHKPLITHANIELDYIAKTNDYRLERYAVHHFGIPRKTNARRKWLPPLSAIPLEYRSGSNLSHECLGGGVDSGGGDSRLHQSNERLHDTCQLVTGSTNTRDLLR